jgi:hypothetical protein
VVPSLRKAAQHSRNVHKKGSSAHSEAQVTAANAPHRKNKVSGWDGFESSQPTKPNLPRACTRLASPSLALSGDAANNNSLLQIAEGHGCRVFLLMMCPARRRTKMRGRGCASKVSRDQQECFFAGPLLTRLQRSLVPTSPSWLTQRAKGKKLINGTRGNVVVEIPAPE